MKIQTVITTALAASLLLVGAAFAAPRLVFRAALAAAPLMQKDVIGLPGKEVRVVIVESAPGGSSQPHRHNAQVFVYMLSGNMTMQVKGSSPITLGPGETFYEGPDDIHAMSKNMSTTAPARYVVFMIMDKGAPGSVPVK